MRLEPNKIKFGMEHSVWMGIPPGIDFKVESVRGDMYELTGYGYGAEGNPGNGSILVFKSLLTDEERELFERHCK